MILFVTFFCNINFNVKVYSISILRFLLVVLNLFQLDAKAIFLICFSYNIYFRFF